jgi:uncharacterized membrane protein YjgN (DUF898 family)
MAAFLIIAVAMISVACATASACPTCKDGMTSDPDTAMMVRGYFWSILFMMSMPFAIFGGVTAYFYWHVRQARLSELRAGAISVHSAVKA